MSAPQVKCLVCPTAASAESLTVNAGTGLSFGSVSAGQYSMGTCFRLMLTRSTAFTVSNWVIWWKRTNATRNGELDEVDLAEGYSVGLAWTAKYLYTSGTADDPADAPIQTANLTSPVEIYVTGDAYPTANVMPSPFRGDTEANGVVLDGGESILSKTAVDGTQVVYTKHFGLSFGPNPTARGGDYTNFALETVFDYS